MHPGLFTDESYVALSFPARTFLTGLWTECDDYGCFEWKPLRLKMRVLPADNIDIEELLSELESHHWIMRYESDGRAYGAVRNFCRFQRPQKPTRFCPTTELVQEWTAENDNDSRTTTEPLHDHYDTPTVIAPQKEGKKERRKVIPPTPIEVPEGLAACWQEWLDYRSEQKLPAYKPLGAKKQLAFLLKQPDPQAVVDQSIRNVWRGLFELKDQPKERRAAW